MADNQKQMAKIELGKLSKDELIDKAIYEEEQHHIFTRAFTLACVELEKISKAVVGDKDGKSLTFFYEKYQSKAVDEECMDIDKLKKMLTEKIKNGEPMNIGWVNTYNNVIGSEDLK